MPVKPRVALVTYSAKPRGGAVHTLHLADALHAAGQPVHVFALGDPREGFFRPLAVPHTIVRAPPPADTLDQRVFDAVDALADGLQKELAGKFDVVHVQDCIAAGAAVNVRDLTGGFPVLRTVHHVDDFTTPALVECQERSILEPDRALAVSRFWRELLAREYGVEATVVTNGVDAARFQRPGPVDPRLLRTRAGADGRLLLLNVGGIEPRKGSYELIEAVAGLRGTIDPTPVLVVVGGHSFQDHRAYRDQVLARAADLDVQFGSDVVVVGTVPDGELPSWYHAADAFVFPSVKEGWGMVLLEAMAAALPVVATDIPVFLEFLADEENALLARAGDVASLAKALRRICGDPDLRSRLAHAGPAVASRYTWQACAAQHIAVYAEMTNASGDS